MKELECTVCGKTFDHDRKGRPPRLCEYCQEEESLDPHWQSKRRVDLLELMLKSRSLHISQHRGEFD